LGSTSRIVLIDGQRLAHLMIDHDIGVATSRTYAIKRVEDEYFNDEDV
jgi:restriction system protein